MRKIFRQSTLLSSCLLLLTVAQSCNSPRTPDYTKTQNESSSPEGNRSSDSTMYNPVTEPGATGTNARAHTNDSSSDSISGGRP